MEETKKRTLKQTLIRYSIEGGAYLAVFVITLFAYIFLKPHIDYQRNGMVAQALMAVALCIVGVVTAYLAITKRLNVARILFLMCIAGFIMRLGYVLYTAGSARQHDTWTPYFDGHEAYAWRLFETGKLPESNVYQFYHPPFNAMVQSAFMHFLDGFAGVMTKLFGMGDYFQTRFTFGKPDYIDELRYFLYSGCQILGVLYSFIICVVSVKTLSMFRFSSKTKILLAAFLIFFPRGIQISGQLNNDYSHTCWPHLPCIMR